VAWLFCLEKKFGLRNAHASEAWITALTDNTFMEMVRANKMGLIVIDVSMAMQGQGTSVHQGGQLVKMDLIIAGADPHSFFNCQFRLVRVRASRAV